MAIENIHTAPHGAAAHFPSAYGGLTGEVLARGRQVITPHTTIADQSAAVEIRLKIFAGKSCKRQHDLRILGPGGFLYVVAISVFDISILKQ